VIRAAIAAAILLTANVFAAEWPDLLMEIQSGREGFRNSKVLEIASGLIDLRAR
jgi:hypothetical protein